LTTPVAGAIIYARVEMRRGVMAEQRSNSAMAKAKNNDFDEFVKRQQVLAVRESIDWDKQRDEWLGHLNALYKNIEAFLKEYVGDGTIKLDFKEHRIIEVNIGAYASRKMIIHIGRQEIVLTPIGTLHIGSKGRVDVEGSAGKARLVLVDKDATGMRSTIKVTIVDPKRPPKPEQEARKDIEWTWKIVTSPPAVAFLELNKDSFFKVLMEVSNA
jgi:hypothetical protein